MRPVLTSTRFALVALVAAIASYMTAAPAGAARSATRDTTAPTIAISTPAAGASVAGTVTIKGSASDNAQVSKVYVGVDASQVGAAKGTTSWSLTVDTRAFADGAHVLSAKATDRSGNSSVANVSVTIANGAPAPSPSPTPTPTTSPSPSPAPTEAPTPPPPSSAFDIAIVNPAVAGALIPVGSGSLPDRNGVTAVLYESMYASQLWARFVDAATGAYSDVRLPVSSLAGLGNAVTAFTGTELFVLYGTGPVSIARYALIGGPLPTSALLATTDGFGNSDSRVGAMVALADGSVVAEWHQQGAAGPQGSTLAVRGPGGSWQTTSVQFMPTRSASTSLAQHPADGSVWLFGSADAFSSIGAARFTLGSSGLTASWTNPYFIDSRYGEFDADPERPDVAAAPDPSTGTIALAYQTAVRTSFGTVTGSKPAVARIPATGAPSFVRLPVYVERISALALAVRPGELWLGYQPVDASSSTFDTLAWSRFANGSWSAPLTRKLYQASGPVVAASSQAVVSARLSDGLIHVLQV